MKLLLTEALEWLQAVDIEPHTDASLWRDNGSCSPENRILTLAPHFSSRALKTVTLLHEMGHLSHRAFWSERKRRWEETRAALLEEELAWLAAELLVEHLGRRLPRIWENDKQYALKAYYGREGYASIAKGRLALGFDETFLASARQRIWNDWTFRQWRKAYPKEKKHKEGNVA